MNILQYMTVDCQNCDGDSLDLGCNKNWWLLCEYFAIIDCQNCDGDSFLFLSRFYPQFLQNRKGESR